MFDLFYGRIRRRSLSPDAQFAYLASRKFGGRKKYQKYARFSICPAWQIRATSPPIYSCLGVKNKLFIIVVY